MTGRMPSDLSCGYGLGVPEGAPGAGGGQPCRGRTAQRRRARIRSSTRSGFGRTHRRGPLLGPTGHVSDQPSSVRHVGKSLSRGTGTGSHHRSLPPGLVRCRSRRGRRRDEHQLGVVVSFDVVGPHQRGRSGVLEHVHEVEGPAIALPAPDQVALLDACALLLVPPSRLVPPSLPVPPFLLAGYGRSPLLVWPRAGGLLLHYSRHGPARRHRHHTFAAEARVDERVAVMGCRACRSGWSEVAGWRQSPERAKPMTRRVGLGAGVACLVAVSDRVNESWLGRCAADAKPKAEANPGERRPKHRSGQARPSCTS